jgi:hypothetical protein
MALSSESLARVRRMLGDFSASFTDDELNAYADDAAAEGARSAELGAVALAFDQLALQALTVTDYRQGETSESAGKVYDRLTLTANAYRKRAGLPLPTLRVKAGTLRYGLIDVSDPTVIGE